MTLVQLKHLLALADTGSFSKAAQLVHLTQPALSRSIRALEAELGMRLIDRLGRRAEPTPFGMELIGRARHLVFEAEELRVRARQLLRGEAGSIRIGLGSGPGAMLMTPLLLQMAKRHPRVRVEVARANTALLVQSLRDRALDALVVDARCLVPAPDLRLEILQQMRGAFLCRRGHPLTRLRRGVTFEDLRPYRSPLRP